MSGLPRLEARDLAAAGRELPAAFECVLRVTTSGGAEPATDDTVIRFLRILRLLPGRRLTALAEVDGRPLVAKLFFGGRAARYCAREARGLSLLAAAGVAAPALAGDIRRDGVHGLLIAFLADARPLGNDPAPWQNAAAALARLHRAGAVHRDPHAGNFLVCATGAPTAAVYMIDGDAVRPLFGRRPPGWQSSLDNLARLGAERPPLADVELPALLEAYALARDWRRSPDRTVAALEALTRATAAHRRERERRYLRKAQRDCTEFSCRRGFRQYLIRVRSAADLDSLLADPEAAMRDAEIVKAGNSATVVRVRLGSRTVIVKRYNRKSPWHALRRALKPAARFRLAWLNGHRLTLLGIPTARPLALLERRFGPLRGVAYLVMEDLGRQDLGGLSADAVSGAVVDGIVRVFRALRAAGLHHGDTKASNFLISTGQVALVDLDALRPVAAGSAAGAAALDRDLQRFLANFDGAPALRQRLEAAFAAAGLVAVVPADIRGVAAPPRRL